MLGIVSYLCEIVTLSLRRAVFSDIRLQKCHDLEIRVRGHSRSSKVVPFDMLRMVFLLVCRKVHRFWDIRLQKCSDLENRVRGNITFDTLHMTSYWRSIVTMALSRVVSENVEKCYFEIGVRGHSKCILWYHSICYIWFPISVL